MSIDRLLHRTVKHLLFLQGVTKHAEGLKKAESLKVIMNHFDWFDIFEPLTNTHMLLTSQY